MQIADSALAAVSQTATVALDAVYLGNSVRAWLIALAVAATTFGALLLVRSVIAGRLEKLAARTSTEVDNYILSLLRHTRSTFMVAVSLSVGSLLLRLPADTRQWIKWLTGLAVIIQVGLWANEIVTLYLRRLIAERSATDMASVTTIRALGMVARLVLWVIIFLMALDLFGVDITALITGLGIAGVAVALAVQNILGDLLASLSIVLDKPFQVGDFIVVDTFQGTVEEVGLKTTRLRSISGEQLIMSNGDLLKARVRNYKRMTERRIVFTFGVEYGTPPEVLEQVVTATREIIEGIEGARYDRGHFFRFGASSLDFEFVYWVTVPDYLAYMDVQQRLNLELMRRLDALGVAFAFPSQTIYLREESTAAVAAPEPTAR